MSLAACLLLYSFAVAVLGPRLLVPMTRAGVAPHLGVAAWLAAIGSVVASWAAAAVFLVAELARDWDQPTRIVSTCFAALGAAATGRAGVLLQLGMLALTGLAITALVVVVYRWCRSLRRARARTHHHARMARVVGRRIPGSDAVVLDAPERVAYCAAGRPATIVITTAALAALDDRHLGAVLAHERAHLAGHHHLPLSATRGLATILPRVELFTTGAAEIARLLEMCADDSAARTYGSHTVLGALLRLTGAAPIPNGALGATGVDVLARAERLATPPSSAARTRLRLVLTAIILLLATGPVATGLLTAAGAALCDPISAWPLW